MRVVEAGPGALIVLLATRARGAGASCTPATLTRRPTATLARPPSAGPGLCQRRRPRRRRLLEEGLVSEEESPVAAARALISKKTSS